MRLWDCTAETKLADLPTASESFVTCVDLGWVLKSVNSKNSWNREGGLTLVSSRWEGSKSVLAASFGDGSVRLFDARAAPGQAR